jgi:DNA-binding PadR family transcriptional regulator
VALRHAVLAALLDRELSGYQLTKLFDVGVADFWYAVPQQLYAELGRAEQAGLISGTEVVQRGRPNKRVFALTEAGHAELVRFAAAPAKPTALRDDLLVKVYAAEAGEAGAIVGQLRARAARAREKIALLDQVLDRMRDGHTEEEHLAAAARVGPYLACRRGRRFEQEQLEWCEWAAGALARREPGG